MWRKLLEEGNVTILSGIWIFIYSMMRKKGFNVKTMLIIVKWRQISECTGWRSFECFWYLTVIWITVYASLTVCYIIFISCCFLDYYSLCRFSFKSLSSASFNWKWSGFGTSLLGYIVDSSCLKCGWTCTFCEWCKLSCIVKWMLNRVSLPAMGSFSQVFNSSAINRNSLNNATPVSYPMTLIQYTLSFLTLTVRLDGVTWTSL